MTTDRGLNMALGVLSLCAIVITGLVVRRELSPASASASRSTVVRNWRTLAREGQRLGPPNAAITILNFSDFQCPYCRQLDHSLRSIRHRRPKEVAVVYRHFPLEAIHPHAFGAAVASECAAQQQRFEELHNVLYDRQDSIGALSWAAFAMRAGVADSAAFAACMVGRAAAERVRADVRAGMNLEITGTPTVVVNGVRLNGTPSQAVLDSLIVALLQRPGDASGQ